MFQSSVDLGPFEQRRRRRYSFSSRMSLAAALAIVEGLGAALLLLVAFRLTVPEPALTANAVLPECALMALILGALSFSQARRALASPDAPNYPVAQAFLASIVSLAVAGFVTAGSGMRHLGSAEIGWAGLAFVALAMVGLLLAFRHIIKKVMGRGRLQVERLATPQRTEDRTLHDLYYMENWSIALDFWILCLTVFSARTRSHAE